MKRIYDPYIPADGLRVLVDGLWPRGVKKNDAGLTLWMKEIAPSRELRSWFGHRPERWEAFRRKYIRELEQKTAAINKLNELAQNDTLTLIYAARDRIHNHARVIADYLTLSVQAPRKKK